MNIKGVTYLLLLAAAYYFLAVLSFDTFANDPGVGWHLADGLAIASSGVVPVKDSFLVAGGPWISDQWLSDLFLARLYRIGGWPFLYAVLTALYFAAFLLVPYRTGRKVGLPYVAMVISVLFMAKLATIHFILRPVIISFLLFSFTYAILLQVTRASAYDKLFERRNTLLLGLLFLSWANLHPSFLLGVFLFGVIIVSIIVEKFLLESEISSTVTHRMIFLVIALLVVTLINPYGFSLHQSILSLSQSSFFMTLNEEWKPLQLASGEGGQFIFILFFVLVGIYLFGREALRITLFELLSFSVFGYLSLNSVRYVPYFAVVSIPLFASVLTSFFRLRSTSPDGKEKGIFTLAALCLAGYSLITSSVPFYSGELGPTRDAYPYEAVEALRSLYPERDSISVFNHPNYGGFLTWESKGWIKPFIDDRNTLNGEDAYKHFLESTRKDATLKAFKGSFDAVLVRKKDLDKQCNALDGLSVIAESPQWVLAR